MPIIEVSGLTRRFKRFTAVDDVTFDVEPGEIFGFLGPNGAGKSTTINMLCTLLKPTSGTATIDGRDVRTDQAGVRRSIGLIFQEPTLDTRLTAWQNLQFHAMLYDMPAEAFKTRAPELLEMVELSDKMRVQVASFSGGMKRRLEIALGLLHHPKVLFLDEPTIGLDPQTRLRIWEYLRRARDTEGLTLFLTTHYMDEAEVCDRIAVIDKGRIVALDSPDGLKSATGGDVVTLGTSADAKAVVELARIGVSGELTDDGVRVVTDRGDEFIPATVRALDAAAEPVHVWRARLRRPTLDDVFVRLTGRDIREEEVDSSEQLRAEMRRHAGGGR